MYTLLDCGIIDYQIYKYLTKKKIKFRYKKIENELLLKQIEKAVQCYHTGQQLYLKFALRELRRGVWKQCFDPRDEGVCFMLENTKY